VDAFDMAQRRLDDTESHREADTVVQHIFQFRSGRRTDRRGRAVAFADGGLTVVDDHDIPFEAAQAALDTSGEAFPALAPSQERGSAARWGPQPAPRSDVGFPSLAELRAEPVRWGAGIRAPRKKAAAPEASPQGLLEFGTGWDD
jgi:hypothetical protein